jgi:hypothetical protein
VNELLPFFMGEHPPDLRVSSLDQHPNEKAHAIAARGLEPFLLNLMDMHENRCGE